MYRGEPKGNQFQNLNKITYVKEYLSKIKMYKRGLLLAVFVRKPKKYFELR